MDNQELKPKYDEMHKQGATAWYGDGREERETILKMGEPWEGLRVIEIGCGEGDLCLDIGKHKVRAVIGYDYSSEAIRKAQSKSFQIENVFFYQFNYKDITSKDMRPDILVMQGVLEHLDDPFGELQWMIEHFKPKTVITSSPCFLNPRGIVWMTLDMLGAVMSKTDLHYLHPWEFQDFCYKNKYKLSMKDCDLSWGGFHEMVEDLEQRIPLALKDGKIVFEDYKIKNFISWLFHVMARWHNPTGRGSFRKFDFPGATMVYRIDI